MDFWKKSNWKYYLVSLAGIVLMMLSSTKWTKWTEWNPLLWLVTGFMFIFPLFAQARKNGEGEVAHQYVRYSHFLFIALISVSTFLIFKEMDWVIRTYVDDSGSDVIPSLEAYVQRFLAGDPVYVEIPFDNYSVLPTYFPAMWMPYIVPEIFEFDYRYMAIGSFLLVYIIIAIIYLKKNPSLIHAFILALLPVLFVKWYTHYDVSVFVYATELMPLVFYMLLALGLTQKKWWLIGLSLGLCTMSRYAYTLYIIPFVFIVWKEWGFMNLLKIGLTGIAVILVLYILPFYIKDPAILTNGFAYYSRTATDQWQTQFWQEEGALPYHLTNGLSFSYHFYTIVDGDATSKLNAAKLFNLIFSLLTAISIIVFWVLKPRKIKWNDYLALALFIYLIVFYSFLYVPFSYLFMLPLGLGLTLFAIFGSKGLKY